MGDITLDMETYLEEMVDDHNLQHGEIIYLVLGWLKIHRPDAAEEYLNGTHPNLYGPPKN